MSSSHRWNGESLSYQRIWDEEHHVAQVETSPTTCVAVSRARKGGRTFVVLQGYKREGAGWTYHGREVVIPADKVDELIALLAKGKSTT